MTIELSKYLKEDVIVKEINNAHFIILGEGINTEYRIQNTECFSQKIGEYGKIPPGNNFLHKVKFDFTNFFKLVVKLMIYYYFLGHFFDFLEGVKWEFL